MHQHAVSSRLRRCVVYSYAIHWLGVTRNFRHKGLEAFFGRGSKARIQPQHAAKLRRQLGQLDAATGPRDMNMPGWKLHALKGDLKGHWAVWVDENWRLTFTFEGEDATLVDYQDYH